MVPPLFSFLYICDILYNHICLTASDRDSSYVDLQLKNLQLQKFSVIFLVKLYKIMSRICYFSITSLKISLVVKNVPWYLFKPNNYA